MTKTMVIGASPKPDRYAHIVTLRLLAGGFEVVPVGIHPGKIGNLSIVDLNLRPEYSDIHTVTMYLNRINQRPWYEYLLELNPARVIFNPGSENFEFYQLLNQHGIEFLEACTLVMLANGSYDLPISSKRSK